jgi:hypothetical protein
LLIRKRSSSFPQSMQPYIVQSSVARALYLRLDPETGRTTCPNPISATCACRYPGSLVADSLIIRGLAN